MNAREHRELQEKRRWGDRGKNVRPKRPFRTTILVYCEGRETEPNYFRSLKAEDQVALSFDVTVKRGKGGSRLQIVQAVADHVAASSKSYDKKYVIFDTERLDSPEARIDLDDAIRLACQNGFHAYLSNPSFEVWYLAHFIRTCRRFNNADAVIIQLNKYWRKEFQTDYCKSDRSAHSKLKDRTTTAIQHARLVREVDHKEEKSTVSCNSATDVYVLVEYLVTPKMT